MMSVSPLARSISLVPSDGDESSGTITRPRRSVLVTGPDACDSRVLVVEADGARRCVPLLRGSYALYDMCESSALVAGSGILYEVDLANATAQCLGMTRDLRGVAYVGSRIAVLSAERLMIMERRGPGLHLVAQSPCAGRMMVSALDGAALVVSTQARSIVAFGVRERELRLLGEVDAGGHARVYAKDGRVWATVDGRILEVVNLAVAHRAVFP